MPTKEQNTPEQPPQPKQPPHPLAELLALVRQMSNRLEAIAAQHPPDWQLPLWAYNGKWAERIGAKVIGNDSDGITQVIWSGHIYTRRTGTNPQYGPAIWFSRKLDAEEYGRLITFADPGKANPLPDYVRAALRKPQ